MNIDIRKSIRENFKTADTSEIRETIKAGIEDGQEVILPGLGVFFEVLWKNSDENSREYILRTIKDGLN